jgi:hypothetical protein
LFCCTGLKIKKSRQYRISAPPCGGIDCCCRTQPEGNTKVELTKPQETTAPVRTKQETEIESSFRASPDRQREGKLKEAKILYRKVIKIDQR